MTMFHHDGINFHYENMGEGLPVVFCHGLTGDLNQPKNMLVPLPGCRLILWDARAHGLTEPIGDENKLNFAVFADDLCALLDSLELDRVALGGISMGAGVATRFAVDHPSRVAQLFLVRPAWFDQPWPTNLAFVRTVAALIDQESAAVAKEKFVRTEYYRMLTAQSSLAAKAAMSYFDKPGAHERNARLRRIPDSTPLQQVSDASKITCPATIFACRDDPAHPYAVAEQWSKALADAQLMITTASALSDRAVYEQAVRQHVLSLLV